MSQGLGYYFVVTVHPCQEYMDLDNISGGVDADIMLPAYANHGFKALGLSIKLPIPQTDLAMRGSNGIGKGPRKFVVGTGRSF